MLHLVLRAEKSDLTFDVEVIVPDNDGAVNLQLTVRNPRGRLGLDSAVREWVD